MEDIEVSRSEVSISPEDTEDIFTYEERSKYSIVDYTSSEEKYYWEDGGRYAYKEYYTDYTDHHFTTSQLIDYYVKHTSLVGVVRHKSHDQIMVAGKHYKELWDVKIEEIIASKMNKLRQEKYKLRLEEERLRLKHEREVQARSQYVADLESHKAQLEQFISTIRNRESNPEFCALMDFHQSTMNALKGINVVLVEKDRKYRKQRKLLDSLQGCVDTIFAGYGRDRVNIEKSRLRSSIDHMQVRCHCASLIEYQMTQVSQMIRDLQRYMNAHVFDRKIATYNNQIDRINNLLKGHIMEEAHASSMEYIDNLVKSGNGGKYGWETINCAEWINQKKSSSLYTEEVPDYTQTVEEYITKLRTKAYRISFVGRFNRYVLMQDLWSQ